MKKGKLIIYLLLIISLTEVIDEEFLISIPGFPLSLGRLCFCASGIYMLMVNRISFLKSKLITSILVIYLGIALSTIVSGTGTSELLGTLVLLTGAIGNIFLWKTLQVKKILKYFYITLYAYWMYKIYLSSSSLINSGIYSREIINHHVPGLLISVSSVFIAAFFFYFRSSKIYLMLFLLSSIITCIYIESRSNTIFLMLFTIYLNMPKKINFNGIFKLIPVMLLFIYFISSVVNSSENLTQRFTFGEDNYQERTTNSRITFITSGINHAFDNIIFGRGILNTSILYEGEKVMLHNQYLTYFLSGGIISLFGIIFFLKNILIQFSRIRFLLKYWTKSKWEFAVFLSSVLFFITLFTIENGGLLYYLNISLISYSILTLHKIHILK